MLRSGELRIHHLVSWWFRYGQSLGIPTCSCSKPLPVIYGNVWLCRQCSKITKTYQKLVLMRSMTVVCRTGKFSWNNAINGAIADVSVCVVRHPMLQNRANKSVCKSNQRHVDAETHFGDGAEHLWRNFPSKQFNLLCWTAIITISFGTVQPPFMWFSLGLMAIHISENTWMHATSVSGCSLNCGCVLMARAQLVLFRVGDSALDSVTRFSTQKIPWSAPELLPYSERHVSPTHVLHDSCYWHFGTFLK